MAVEEKKPARRKSRRAKVEDYYKILGVRANATQAVIKRKYIESVKAFPPETHPEQFQQIRRAYETLRDPSRRSEYDIRRKYGDKLEKLMEQAFKYTETGEWRKAEELCRQAVRISPENPSVRMALGGILLERGDQDGFKEQFAAAFDLTSEDIKPVILVMKARLFSEHEMSEEALQVLEQARERYPELLASHPALFLEVYIDMGMDQEALSLAGSALPSPDSRDPEDIFALINYLNVVLDLERWDKCSKIQIAIRKFIKGFADEEDRLLIQAALVDEHDQFYHMGLFRQAEALAEAETVFSELTKLLDRDLFKTAKLLEIMVLNLSGAVSQEFPWLQKVEDINLSNGLLHTYSIDAIKSEFLSRIRGLVQVINKYELHQTEGIIRKTCQYITDHVEQDINLELVANAVHVSKDYLGKLFKHKTGVNFSDYLTKIKMEHAKHLLGTGEYKNYEVSEKLGYSNPDYFCRLFKNYTGCTPMQFRQRGA